MPDNTGYTPGSGVKVASREVTYFSETVQSNPVALMGVHDRAISNKIEEGG